MSVMTLVNTVLCLAVAGSVVVQAALLNPFLDAARHKESLSRLESCFCQVGGVASQQGDEVRDDIDGVLLFGVRST